MRPLRVLSHLPRDLCRRLGGELPELEIVEVPQEGEPPAGVAGEVLLTLPWGTPNLEPLLARGVRWVHAIGTGVDRFPLDSVGGRILTCSRGGSAIPIAEWVLAMLLAFEKRLPESWVDRPPPAWMPNELGGLAGRTLGIVGLGEIGSAVARRALGFEMRVLGLRRSGGPSPVPGVEMAGDLAQVLAEADHLLVAAAATAATHHLIGREALAATKPGVHLVNVARGSLVDQEALREALDAGRVARASLDVCDPEPLPEGHWLYTHPRVRLSPHLSWSAPDALERLFACFVENARRYREGRPLAGRVDLVQGY